MLNPSSLYTRLVTENIATPRCILGCNDAEIQNVGTTLGLPLPRAYVEFLRVAGRRAGAFLRDVDIFFPAMLTLRERSIRILDDCEAGRLILPNNAVVFAMRNGEQFMFFCCEPGLDDPPIQSYYEGARQFEIVDRSIWGFLESELETSEEFRRMYPRSPLITPPE